MTHISPCFRCPLSEGCDHRAELRRRVKGLGARSVRFKCDRLAAEVRPGRRIVIRHPIREWTDFEYEYAIRKIEVAATIAAVDGDCAFSAVIDPGLIEAAMGDDPAEWAEEVTPETVNARRFRRRQKAHRIVRFLDEPDRTFCPNYAIRGADGTGCDFRDKENGCACEREADRLALFPARIEDAP